MVLKYNTKNNGFNTYYFYYYFIIIPYNIHKIEKY